MMHGTPFRGLHVLQHGIMIGKSKLLLHLWELQQYAGMSEEVASTDPCWQ